MLINKELNDKLISSFTYFTKLNNKYVVVNVCLILTIIECIVHYCILFYCRYHLSLLSCYVFKKFKCNFTKAIRNQPSSGGHSMKWKRRLVITHFKGRSTIY